MNEKIIEKLSQEDKDVLYNLLKNKSFTTANGGVYIIENLKELNVIFYINKITNYKTAIIVGNNYESDVLENVSEIIDVSKIDKIRRIFTYNKTILLIPTNKIKTLTIDDFVGAGIDVLIFSKDAESIDTSNNQPFNFLLETVKARCGKIYYI